MNLANRIKAENIPDVVPTKGSVWKGPEVDGITFSLLSRFLCCRERFRILVMEGLSPADAFNHRLEYGNMWHLCEESLARGGTWAMGIPSFTLSDYVRDLHRRYPTQAEQIDHWYNVCLTQFPIYVRYWKEQPQVRARTPLLQEKAFNVPYPLPSGRVVRLRGKWDSVDLIGRGNTAGIWLQENKTKADIDEVKIKRQLNFDLQTMLYLVALREYATPSAPPTDGSVYGPEEFNDRPIAGVRYNVVRRPLSGGKGSIIRYKPSKQCPLGESKASFYNRLRGIIEESPGTYFMRWTVDILPADVTAFRRQCLDPILEQLCDWWDWMNAARDPFDADGIHWRHPFGVYNTLDEGGSSDLDEYLATGSEIGLRKVSSLFPELEGQ